MPHADASHDQVLANLWAIWEDVLEISIADPEINFFDAGGDSLLALIIANRAADAGLSMPRSGVLRRPTLSSLAEAVRNPAYFDMPDPDR